MKKLNLKLWSQSFDEITKTLKEKMPENVAVTIGIANQICGNNFSFSEPWDLEQDKNLRHLGEPINWEYIPAGDPEWMFALNRHRFFVTLGKSWRYTKNKDYPQAFIRIFSQWLDNAKLSDESKSTSWRSIEAGFRIENWLRSLGLFSDYPLPKELLGQVYDSLMVHGEYLENNYSRRHSLSNWGIIQSHGLFLIGAALGRKDWCSVGISRLEGALKTQFSRDGVHWEQSPMYHGEMLSCYLDTMLVGRNIGVKFGAEFVARVYNGAKALAFMQRPDGRLFLQADSDEVDVGWIIALAALLFKAGQLKAYAGEIGEESYWSFFEDIPEYHKIEMVEKEGSVALKDSGNYMLCQKGSENQGFLHFHCGSLGGGHGHGDLLHIDLFSRGENILTDSGRYSYANSPKRLEIKSPSAHNTITVDNLNFAQPVDSWIYSRVATPIKGEHCFSEKLDFVEGWNLGYFEQGVVLSRSILRLGRDLWVVVDYPHTTKGNTSKIQRYFNFGSKGAVSLSDDGVEYSGEKACGVLCFPNNDSVLNLEPTQISPHYNALEDTSRLRVENSVGGGLFTVIATGEVEAGAPDLSCRILPLSLELSGKKLGSEEGEGLEIALGKKKFVVIIAHKEINGEVDFLKAGNCAGIGRVIVFDDDCKDGITLKW